MRGGGELERGRCDLLSYSLIFLAFQDVWEKKSKKRSLGVHLFVTASRELGKRKRKTSSN